MPRAQLTNAVSECLSALNEPVEQSAEKAQLQGQCDEVLVWTAPGGIDVPE
jgi:hypothetical protein